MTDLAARLTLLAEALNTLAASPLISHQFQVLGEASPSIIPCDWLGLCLRDGDAYSIHPLYDSVGVADPHRVWALDEGAAGESMTTRQASIGRLDENTAKTGPERRLHRAAMRQMLLAPVIGESQVIGAIFIASNRQTAFTGDDLHLARLLAAGLAAALDSARLFQQLGDQHALLETLMSSARDGVLVINNEGLILLANPASGRLLGDDPRLLTGRPISQCSSTRALATALDRMVDGSTAELELPHGVTAQVSRLNVTGEFGEAVGYAATLRDVSLLKDLDRIRAELLRSLSHDLRGPLGTLGLAAGMLSKADALEPRHHLACQQMFNAIDYMDQLVSELSDLGQMESGSSPAISRGDLVSAVREVLELMRVRANERAQILQLSGEESLTFDGDYTQLKRMIFNLIGNALKYTPDNGHIDVSVYESDLAAVIEVRDDGIGIPEQDIPRLFDRTFRVDNAETRAMPGTGLGLAIVRHVVDAHGGRAEVDSRLGQGSCFRVALPLASAIRT